MAKVALLIFALPPHPFGGVLDSPGVFLLLENGVARNGGDGNPGGEGEWDMEPSLCLNQALPSFSWAKGAGYFHGFGVKRCSEKDKCVYRIPVLLL